MNISVEEMKQYLMTEAMHSPKSLSRMTYKEIITEYEITLEANMEAGIS